MRKKYRHSINLYHIIANPIKRFYCFFSRPEFCGVKSLIQHKDTFYLYVIRMVPRDGHSLGVG